MDHANLSIVMHRHLDTGEWFVERIDAHFNNIRNQTRFITPYPIRFAFQKSFVDFLGLHLPVRGTSSIVTIEDAQTESGLIGLNGVRIIAQRAAAGLQSVTVRIQNYVGTISNILAEKTMINLGLAIGLRPDCASIFSAVGSEFRRPENFIEEHGLCQLE